MFNTRDSKYTDGLDMKQFNRINDISSYNNNYYVGFDNYLLFGKSDDDNTTEWYVVFNETFYYLGESYTSENELLHRFDSRRT